MGGEERKGNREGRKERREKRRGIEKEREGKMRGESSAYQLSEAFWQST